MKFSTFYRHILDAEKQTGIQKERLLEELRENGLNGLEFCYDDVTPATVCLLKQMGLEASSIYRRFSYETDPNPAPGRELVELSLTLGCKKVLCVPGFYPVACDRESVRRRMVAPITDLVNYAMACGVTVTIEDFDAVNSPTASSGDMKWFADRIPGLCYTLDTGNFYFSAENEMDAFERLQDKIRHVHCKDRALHPVKGEAPTKNVLGVNMYPTAFGSGVIKCQALMQGLLDIGYDDYLVSEHFNAADQYQCIRKSLKWMQTFCSK